MSEERGRIIWILVQRALTRKLMSKIIYATVRLLLDDDADIGDVVAETDYSFKHPNILDTDWFDVSEGE